MKKIAIIGSTGSIGRQTLNVIRRHPELFEIVSLASGSNASLLLEQIFEFKPKIATSNVEIGKNEIPKDVDFYSGEDAFLSAICNDADIVVVALVGFLGIKAVLKAINMGKDVALANKESLVVGGETVISLAKEKGVKILPIDSEHSAVWQALSFDFNTPFNKIILTASGGAFRDLPLKKLNKVTAKEALNHPNWKMGQKITVDCATMVNKAYEVAEAKWLYNTTFDKIDVIIHRESIIHSMVEFVDGAVIAQMGYPSMEIPIALALNYPDRITSAEKSLDFAKLQSLSFSEVDAKRYPCFFLALSAIKKGGAYPAVLNGADEEAVKLFLEGKISYNDIERAIDGAIQSFNGDNKCDYQSISLANEFAVDFVNKKFGV